MLLGARTEDEEDAFRVFSSGTKHLQQRQWDSFMESFARIIQKVILYFILVSSCKFFKREG